MHSLYFKFQFSISAARRQGISQVGRRRLTPLALPVPNTPHTSLRDSLDQKRVPENFVFLGEIFIHVTHFRDSFNQRGPQNPAHSRAKKIPSSTIPPKTPHLGIPSIRSVDMSSKTSLRGFLDQKRGPRIVLPSGIRFFRMPFALLSFA